MRNQSETSAETGTPPQATTTVNAGIAATAPGQLRVIKRNGTVVPFEGSKISVAITKAFLAVEGGTAAASGRIHETVAKLTEQVAKMNRAPEGQKTDLVAVVLTQMVKQRSALDVRKAKMQNEMMQHMMQHMQMGKESMAQCPMMKGMKGMKDMDGKSGDAHKEHQTEQK